MNDELGELRRGLAGAEEIIEEDGRLVVVSFHSLEDRIVKQFMAERSGRSSGGSRHVPGPLDRGPEPSFKQTKKNAVKPSDEELEVNPRARSSRLRVANRTAALAKGEWHA